MIRFFSSPQLLLLMIAVAALLSSPGLLVSAAFSASLKSYNDSACTALVQTFAPNTTACVRDIIDTTKYMTVTCADSTATSAWTINTVASSTCVGMDTQQASGSNMSACVAFNGYWVKVRNHRNHSNHSESSSNNSNLLQGSQHNRSAINSLLLTFVAAAVVLCLMVRLIAAIWAPTVQAWALQPTPVPHSQSFLSMSLKMQHYHSRLSISVQQDKSHKSTALVSREQTTE